MMDRTKLIKKLTNERNDLKKRIENRKLYNVRNFVISSLIHSGIIIDYALPFIVSGFIIGNYQEAKGNAPFIYDDVVQEANIKSVDFSSGKHIQLSSYDYKYDDRKIEYSTSWVIDDDGFYQRTLTSYRISDDININDLDKLLSMSKEEIDNALIMTNIETIKKSKLDHDDYLYDEDALIVTNHYKSNFESITRPESFGENLSHTLLFLILVFFTGTTLNKVGKIIIKNQIKDYLKTLLPLYEPITNEKVKEMIKLLKLKDQNLELMTSDIEQKDNIEEYQYVLRKV